MSSPEGERQRGKQGERRERREREEKEEEEKKKERSHLLLDVYTIHTNLAAIDNGHCLPHGLENPYIRSAQGQGLLISLQILSTELLGVQRG